VIQADCQRKDKHGNGIVHPGDQAAAPPGRWVLTAAACGTLLAIGGCKPPAVTFPAAPIARTPTRVDYDVNGNGRADFFYFPNSEGRYDRIGYDRNGDGKPDQIVHLDAVNPRLARHLVIVLDGIPYDTVAEYYKAGNLRIFHAPTVVIAPYPSMTDQCLEDAFGYMPTEGMEARYYSRSRRQVVGGTGDYLSGRNEPFVQIISYRGPTLDDGLGYLWPCPLFHKEINEVKRVWDRRRHQEEVMYLVSTATVGTRLGRAGHLSVLCEVQRLINQVVYETGGLVKVTMFADHGQTQVPAKPARLKECLESKGWRLTDRPRGPKDVALVQYGLVTCAALNTPCPAALAKDLLTCPAVNLVSYSDCDKVIVRSRCGTATIQSTDGKRFRYAFTGTDPLCVGVKSGSVVDGRAVLNSSVAQHKEYPDAVYRLWRAHFALVENPPDVLVSLDSRYYNGAGGFGSLVDVASTHGGLTWRDSATFFMSSAARVPGPLRSEDIPCSVGKIFCRGFPAGR